HTSSLATPCAAPSNALVLRGSRGSTRPAGAYQVSRAPGKRVSSGLASAGVRESASGFDGFDRAALSLRHGAEQGGALGDLRKGWPWQSVRLVAPSVSILGSFFPAWLISIVIGLLLTVVVLRVLVATGTASYLRPAGVAYVSLVFLLIFATWLIVFGS